MQASDLEYVGEVDVPEPVLVELFNGELEPPVRSHEGERHRDLCVHRAQGPVLRTPSLRYITRGSQRHVLYLC